jgi:predicted GNAT family N-acyltransferase
MPYRFEALDANRHSRAAFGSSVEALNLYLRQQARKDAVRHLAATFVMVDDAAPREIVGYYTLSNYTVELAELPEDLRRKLPRYPRLPATLIGRLARDERFPGVGALLLIDALARAYAQTKGSGSLAVVAEAKDDRARRFYGKHGFLQLGKEPNRLYLAMGSIEQLIRPSG